jgi:hypothetical protein
MGAEAINLLFTSALLATACVACARRWLGSLKEARASEDIATSRIQSAAQGYVELQGVARPLDDGALASPFLGLEAVWWKCTHRTHGKNRNRTPYVERTSTKRFYLEDASGRCLIDPAGAQVTSSTTHTWHAEQPGPPDPSTQALTPYICTETVLAPGTRLYVRGEFRTVRVGAQALDLMRDKLAAWQADDKKRAILDVDRDGKLSATELEAARRAALLDARREAGTATGTMDLVCKPADGRPFVISDKRQHVHARTHLMGAVWALLGAIASGVALLVLLVSALG